MAKMWFSVIVLIFIQNVFANNNMCPQSDTKVTSCDQCVRCGGNWCSDEKPMGSHCYFSERDDSYECQNPDKVFHISRPRGEGAITPKAWEKTVYVNKYVVTDFLYAPPGNRNVSYMIQNSTHNRDSITVDLYSNKDDCHHEDGKCKLSVEMKVDENFCTSTSSTQELVEVTLKMENVTEQVNIYYYVQCACECSKKVLPDAPACHGNGNFSCGICSCHKGWKGTYCDEADCGDRGDIPGNCHDVGCSGNGKCGPCGACVCETNKEGSRYFDPKNMCSDICSLVSDYENSNCGQCLNNTALGTCPNTPGKHDCSTRITKLKYDETLVAEKDEFNRKIWISCTETVVLDENEHCNVTYLARKLHPEDNNIDVMVVKYCNGSSIVGIIPGGQTGATSATKVPLILGVLGVLAAVAAVGGVLLWKHLNAAPPMPFASPDYQNIDAEDCVGENPLYKSPTSTFTNPQFGKC